MTFTGKQPQELLSTPMDEKDRWRSDGEHLDPYRKYAYSALTGEIPKNLDEALHGFYEMEEIQVLKKDLEWLFASYSVKYLAGLAHYAPSPSLRDEMVTHLTLPTDKPNSRFAIRLHCFETGSNSKPGRYLGFVHFRATKPVKNGDGAPGFLVEAELVRPKHMLRPRFHILDTTTSSARLGVLPFRSTFFMSAVGDSQRKSTCAHLAVSQALHLTTTRFGTRPISEREFETILWTLAWESQNQIAINSISRDGVLPENALKAVARYCGAGGFIASITESTVKGMNTGKDIYEEALRCLTDCLACGLPSILFVDASKLPRVVTHIQPPREPHALLVLGMHLLHSANEFGCKTDPDHREDHDELPGTFVCHDLGQGPFVELPASTVLEAALECPTGPEENQINPGIRFMTLGPEYLTFGIDKVRILTLQLLNRINKSYSRSGQDFVILEDYFKNGLGLPLPQREVDFRKWRLVTRLLRPSELEFRYNSLGQPPLEKILKSKGVLNEADNFESMGLCWAVELRATGYGYSTSGIQMESRLQLLPFMVFVWPISLTLGSNKNEELPPQPHFILRYTGKEAPLQFYRKGMGKEGKWPVVHPRGQALESEENEKLCKIKGPLLLPEISLITSWSIPPSTIKGMNRGVAETNLEPRLVGLEDALRNRVQIHDLYFLDQADLAWYQATPNLGAAKEFSDSLSFAAGLKPNEVRLIAEKLDKHVCDHYKGPAVGPRPRIAAIATYWPLISLPDDEAEGLAQGGDNPSVKAIINSLILAHELGCHHVEIVGGSRTPEGQTSRNSEIIDPKNYYEHRLQTLANRLDSIVVGWVKVMGEVTMPKLLLEIEPGLTFLLKDLQSFRDLFRYLDEKVAKYVFLNVDVAHFLLNREGPHNLYDGYPLGNEGQKQWLLLDKVGGMHCSDHSRSHASDLSPGTYHFSSDYRPFLELAIERTMNSKGTFSGSIAVELEAIGDIHEATRAMSRLSKWLEDIAATHNKEKSGHANPSTSQYSGAKGTILVIDLGNSTKAFFGKKDQSVEKGALELEDSISKACQEIHRHRGSVLSFTGDGIVAFFDETQFALREDCASKCLEAALQLGNKIVSDSISTTDGETNTTLRVALHSGEVHIPSHGRLKHQVIGKDVVITARLCDWISKTIEPSVSRAPLGGSSFSHKDVLPFICACTESFYGQLELGKDGIGGIKFAMWGAFKPKGLSDSILVFLDENYLLRPIAKTKPNREAPPTSSPT